MIVKTNRLYNEGERKVIEWKITKNKNRIEKESKKGGGKSEAHELCLVYVEGGGLLILTLYHNDSSIYDMGLHEKDLVAVKKLLSKAIKDIGVKPF